MPAGTLSRGYTLMWPAKRTPACDPHVLAGVERRSKEAIHQYEVAVQHVDHGLDVVVYVAEVADAPNHVRLHHVAVPHQPGQQVLAEIEALLAQAPDVRVPGDAP